MLPFILANAAPGSSEISPTAVGIFVLIAIQLSQFFFAYQKNNRDGQAVLKSDLDALKRDLEKQINAVGADMDLFDRSVTLKMETSRKESIRAREEIRKDISALAVSTATVMKGLEVIEQAQIAQATKLDLFLSRSKS